MWKSDLELDKYQYVRVNPYWVRFLGLMGIITALYMGYGLWLFASIRPIYLVVFGPIIAIFIVNKVLRYFVQTFYPKFSIQRHEQFVREFWQKNHEPSVAVFLPWAGEDLDVHEEVLRGVAKLRYSNYQVYMLDDKGSQEHKQLAHQYGFHYLSRPNKGEHKKSGNLQYGYENSQGEFVLILDADFIPYTDYLYDLIPYIATDKGIGILQTPQYFEQSDNVHDRSWIEFGGGNIVEDFYRIMMPCRDEFRAAMCVGTSAIYRRAAIDKLDGTPKVHASEDLATGLLITQFGFYVKYLPLVLSMGKSPETYEGYFKQHMRWCSGNLVFARYWPFAHLNLMARIIYIVNPLYYMSEALTVIFSFQFLILLYFHSDSLSLWNSLYFLPYIFLNRILIPNSKATPNRLGTKLAALSNSYTYFYTYLRMLAKGVPSWQPTGVKTSKLHDDFVRAFDIGTIISSLFILSFLFVLLSRPEILGNYHTYLVLGWTFYSIFWHALFLTFVMQYIHHIKLPDLTTMPHRGLLYVKTHALLVLFWILIGSTFTNIVLLNMNQSNVPTKQALYDVIVQANNSN